MGARSAVSSNPPVADLSRPQEKASLDDAQVSHDGSAREYMAPTTSREAIEGLDFGDTWTTGINCVETPAHDASSEATTITESSAAYARTRFDIDLLATVQM